MKFSFLSETKQNTEESWYYTKYHDCMTKQYCIGSEYLGWNILSSVCMLAAVLVGENVRGATKPAEPSGAKPPSAPEPAPGPGAGANLLFESFKWKRTISLKTSQELQMLSSFTVKKIVENVSNVLFQPMAGH